MAGKGVASAMQLRHENAYKTLILTKPRAQAATVSAAAVFKNQKIDAPKDRIAQPKASQDYRCQLYDNTVARINQDLETLLSKLYEGNLQVISSDPVSDAPQASPLKLTVTAKYQRVVQKICQPLSIYRYNVRRRSGGDVVRVQKNLHDRIQAFEERVRPEKEQIKVLQRQWDEVVAEILLGIAYLGESDIAALLSPSAAGLNASHPSSGTESTLFVPEQEIPSKRAGEKRKHISFARPDMKKLFPSFLFHTSGQQKSISAVPDLSMEEIR
ncbi:hypothetical protein G6514_008025 [Epicoccum nigrum]|nr:hypothetical protein G6514_008025 [Epicoccum nigrum]